MRRIIKVLLSLKILIILNWLYYFNYYQSSKNKAVIIKGNNTQIINAMATIQSAASSDLINSNLVKLNGSQLTQQLQQLMLAKNLKFFLFKSNANEIYCRGELLHTIQMSNIFVDSKTFVDMPTKYEHGVILQNFKKLGSSPNKYEIEMFIKENFHPIGHDVTIVEPLDWKESPTFLKRIRDERVHDFGDFLNRKWKSLLRKQDKSKICPSCITSVIETSNPFIVPGGRFIEYYYWDTYWVIDGLLSSDMIETAKGIIHNFLEIVEINGFVPNGARVYYLNRSQPPLLAQMVDIYFQKTNDLEFLKYALNLLDQEYYFWMSQRVYAHKHSNGKTYNLNLYNAKSTEPRPESYKEDYINAKESGNEIRYYSNIISAAESGWDFSSRWFTDPMDIKSIAITDILPVDLNSIMLKNEKTLHHFHKLLGSSAEVVQFYVNAIASREEAINSVLWDESLHTWADFNYKLNKLHTDYVYISDLSPLWAGIHLDENNNIKMDIDKILPRYKSLLMDYKSGIPASNIYSQQQWDFPNVWAPYHLWMVEFFRSCGRDEVALNIAQRFVNTAYVGWLKTNKTMIFEKYDANNIGANGEGGEYVVQEGFGWTNGVVIKFMELFGDKLTVHEDDE